ncbi:MAG: hypothetical protein K0S33_1145, partial [Bacteroidetes bacterium]|nr:hypothetical protein [Bacteroidota bacterium]
HNMPTIASDDGITKNEVRSMLSMSQGLPNHSHAIDVNSDDVVFNVWSGIDATRRYAHSKGVKSFWKQSMQWVDGALQWVVTQAYLADKVNAIKKNLPKQLHSGKLKVFDQPGKIRIGPQDGDGFLLHFMMAAQYELSIGNTSLRFDKYFEYLQGYENGLNFVNASAEVNGMKIDVSDIEVGVVTPKGEVELTYIPHRTPITTLYPVTEFEPGAIQTTDGNFYRVGESNYVFDMTFLPSIGPGTVGAYEAISFHNYRSSYGISGLHISPVGFKVIGGMFKIAWGNNIPGLNFLYPF